VRSGAGRGIGHSHPTNFKTRELSESANERLGELKGFREEVIECEKCSAFHLRHIFSGESTLGYFVK
jgi:hypothetical protein